MKRVLLIAYHFPPTGTGGVGRATGWVRHLPAFGWQPTVLASPPPPNWPLDESLTAQIPGDTSVERVAAHDPRGATLRGIAHRELSFLWRRPALAAASQILRAQSHEAILATAPPPVAHALGFRLARMFRLPWVADFRDPWGVRAPALWRRWRRRTYVRSAAAVVAVNDTLRQHLQEALECDVQTIHNGYEPDEIPPGVTRVPRRVVFLGTLSEFNDLDVFYRALAKLDGEFVHIGVTRNYDLRARAHAAGLKRVESRGYLPRTEALRAAATASTFLLSLKGDLELAVSAKTFDYIGLGGPVLCVGNVGALPKFVDAVPGLGACVPAHDQTRIEEALQKLWTPGFEPLPASVRERYARPHLAAQVAALLDRVVSRE